MEGRLRSDQEIDYVNNKQHLNWKSLLYLHAAFTLCGNSKLDYGRKTFLMYQRIV